MNYSKLFFAQAKLDKTIIGDRTIDNLQTKKVEALLCEIQEAANETKCFKYWSVKQPNKEKVIAETADILHFLLSIGNDININHQLVEDAPVRMYTDLTEQFLALTYTVACVAMYNDKQLYYLESIKLFKGLVHLLGFSNEELEQAYFDKNKINHERQTTNY